MASCFYLGLLNNLKDLNNQYGYILFTCFAVVIDNVIPQNVFTIGIKQ